MNKSLISVFAIFWIFIANDLSHYAWGQSDALNSVDGDIDNEEETIKRELMSVSKRIHSDNVTFEENKKIYNDLHALDERLKAVRAKEKEVVKGIHVSFFPDSPSAGGSTGTLEVENISIRDVKDITFICDHYAPSGTVLGRTENTLYRAIAANKKEVVENFNLGYVDSQVIMVACAAIHFK